MKRINNSQPLSVVTQFRPLSTSMNIEVMGGLSVMQFYKSTSLQWLPDHSVEPTFDSTGGQTNGTLRLKATYSVIDPDELLNVEKLSPQVFWYVNDEQITTNDVSADYYITDNILYVRKNFTHTQGAVVSCECRFTDVRTNTPFVLSDSIPLTAVLQADEQWSLTMLCDKTQKHFPIFADTSIYTFQAEAKLGNNVKDDSVAWFWDYSLDNGVTWKEIDDECYWYVSGKNSSALKVDMDFIESITVRVRIAEDSTATTPSLKVAATASCAWRMPILRPNVFCYGGSRVFSNTEFMTFGVQVHVNNHDDLTIAQQKAWLMFDWAKRLQGSTTKTTLHEAGQECTIPGSDLFNMENKKYIIDPQLSIRGVYDVLADSSGNLFQVGSNLLSVRT